MAFDRRIRISSLDQSKNVSVRASPISKTAALLIIALGVFTLFAGLVAGVLINDIAGVAILVLGLFLYRLLFTFSRKLENRIKEIEKQS
jgi:Flp pilus assembly protein TadB